MTTMVIIAILLLIIIFLLLYLVFHMKTDKTSKSTKNVVSHPETPPSKESVPDTPRKNPSGNTTKTASSSNSRKKSTERKTLKMKWRNRMLDISMIPKSVELDRNTLLPQSIKRKYAYGRRFNAFVAYGDDFFYHRSTCSKIQSNRHQPVHRYVALQKMLPCPDCKPNDLIDEWYIEFLKVNFGVDINYNEFSSQLDLPMTSLPEHEKLKIIDGNHSQR